MLNGIWQAGSDLLWPHQPTPPKSYFRTFRTCLRKTFCTKLPGDFYYDDSMELDTPLGRWLPVPRTTWFPVYRTKSELIGGRRMTINFWFWLNLKFQDSTITITLPPCYPWIATPLPSNRSAMIFGLNARTT
jgi:hypothetical protein